MTELQESSGLMSLAALRQQEKERAQVEARAQAEVEQRARLAAEQESAREGRNRARIERASLEAADAARRAEISQLDLAHTAELKRAEREARARRDLELSLQAERNGRRVAELGFVAHAAHQRFIATLLAAVCLLTWFGGVGGYFGLLRPGVEEARTTFERSLASERQARVQAEAERAQAGRRGDELAQRVSSLEQRLRDGEATKALLPPAHSVPHGSGGGQQSGVTTRPPCKDDGDPLNPCLKR